MGQRGLLVQAVSALTSWSGIEAKEEWLDARVWTTNLFWGVAASASRIIRSCNARGTGVVLGGPDERAWDLAPALRRAPGVVDPHPHGEIRVEGDRELEVVLGGQVVVQRLPTEFDVLRIAVARVDPHRTGGHRIGDDDLARDPGLILRELAVVVGGGAVHRHVGTEVHQPPQQVGNCLGDLGDGEAAHAVTDQGDLAVFGHLLDLGDDGVRVVREADVRDR